LEERVMGKLIGIAEFKANCTRLLREMERDGQPITVTKRGKPVAELTPVGQRSRAETLFGLMKGSVTILGDIEGPVSDGPWNAELGLLGDED
jgi:prevent-host-death family protein